MDWNDLLDRLDRLEDKVCRKIDKNSDKIDAIVDAASQRKLGCIREFATKSYVRSAFYILLIVIILATNHTVAFNEMLNTIKGLR